MWGGGGGGVKGERCVWGSCIITCDFQGGGGGGSMYLHFVWRLEVRQNLVNESRS